MARRLLRPDLGQGPVGRGEEPQRVGRGKEQPPGQDQDPVGTEVLEVLPEGLDGQQMFLEQKVKVDGDVSLLMRMNEFFGE